MWGAVVDLAGPALHSLRAAGSRGLVTSQTAEHEIRHVPNTSVEGAPSRMSYAIIRRPETFGTEQPYPLNARRAESVRDLPARRNSSSTRHMFKKQLP